MEIIIGLIVVGVAAYFIFRPKKTETVVEVAPYKIETPEAKVEAVNAQPVAEVKPAPAKKAPKAKAPAKKPVAKKPVAKAPAKKPAKAKKPTSK